MPTTFSNEVWRIAKSKIFKLDTPNSQPPEGVMAPLLSLKSWLETTGYQLVENAYEMGGSLRWAVKLKESGLHTAKRGCDD